MQQTLLVSLLSLLAGAWGAGAVGPQETKEEKKEEQVTKAELGKPAPDFELQTLDGKKHKLSDYKGKIVVLEWFDPTCPMCKWAYDKDGPLATLPEKMKAEGVVWLSIDSAGEDKPGSDPKKIEAFVEEYKLKAPILMDTDGKVGRAYEAKTTPHCYVINEKGVLVYRGALDNAPRGQVKDEETKTNYVEAAVKEIKEGRKVTVSDTRPYG